MKRMVADFQLYNAIAIVYRKFDKYKLLIFPISKKDYGHNYHYTFSLSISSN